MKPALIFDLDGTLIDSAPQIAAVANDVLADEGQPPLALDEARRFVGNGVSVFVDRMIAARGLGRDRHAPMVAAFMDGYARDHSLTTLYPGVRAALDHWQAQGRRMAICTNKPIGPTHAVLDHFGLADHFQAVIGGDSLPTRKPDPAMLHAMIDALGEAEVLYVGDSEVDAATAQAANVPFALFTEGYRKTPVNEIPHDIAFQDWTQFRP